MASIIAGMASSHAYALLDPDDWDARREVSRQRYADKYGTPPLENPQASRGSRRRISSARYATTIGECVQPGSRREFDSIAPDALVIIGDDQGENYTDTIPQFALYTGESADLLRRRVRAGVHQLPLRRQRWPQALLERADRPGVRRHRVKRAFP